MERFAVIGGGQMGRGIAQHAAAQGFSVSLVDVDRNVAHKALERISEGLERLVAKGKLSQEEAQNTNSRLEVATIDELHATDWVVEAVPEDFVLKSSILAQLDKIITPTCVLCSNTSSISITRLAACTSHSERVIGMHFMNPVPIMKLVEVIRGHLTSNETYSRALQMIERLGKVAVTSTDSGGFIVNRILMPMINEAIFTLLEGVANAKDIDQAMKLGTNQPMGPLELADFIGLDTCLAILEVMHHEHGDPKYRPCPLLRRLVAAGCLGRKSGNGFFEYKKLP